MSTDSASGRRPVELDDPDWLRRRYARDGDKSIALELHVDRKTVRRARDRLGIPSALPGRRRGIGAKSVSVPDPESQLASRIIAAQEARARGHDQAYDDALRSIASAALLLLSTRQDARAA